MSNLWKTDIFLLKRNFYVHMISIVLLISPLFSKLLSDNTNAVVDYESTFTTVLFGLILSIGFYMQKLMDNKIFCLENIYYRRNQVFDILLIVVEIYCSCIILLFYFIYSLCYDCVNCFFKHSLVILIVYIPIIAIIFCIGYMVNNYIVSSVISWFLFCGVIIAYYALENSFFEPIFPLAWLKKSSNGTVDVIGVGVYAIFLFVLIIILLTITKKVIKKIEYK